MKMKINWQKEVKLARIWLKRNGSTLCNIAGSLGVIATGYFAWESGRHSESEQNLKTVLKENWKPIATGSGTIACIWLGHGIDQRNLAAVSAGYLAIKRSYEEYRSAVADLRPDIDQRIRHGIAKDKWDKTYPNEDELYWDEISQRYFTASPLKVEKAKYELNRLFQQTGVVTLNDLYGFLDIPKVPNGDNFGWDVGMFDAVVTMCLEDYWIDFDPEETYLIDDGDGKTIEARTLSTTHYPVPLIS